MKQRKQIHADLAIVDHHLSKYYYHPRLASEQLSRARVAVDDAYYAATREHRSDDDGVMNKLSELRIVAHAYEGIVSSIEAHLLGDHPKAVLQLRDAQREATRAMDENHLLPRLQFHLDLQAKFLQEEVSSDPADMAAFYYDAFKDDSDQVR